MAFRFPASIDARRFLSTYWQKKPLLCKGALTSEIAALTETITPETLAGLACEDVVESRLIVTGAAPQDLSIEHGPFEPETFSKLPDAGWTLLVQDVDKFIPQVYELLQSFRFLPAWRIDDIMISYAAPDGTVGPHIDQYDVFLIQGHGNRCWQTGSSDGQLIKNSAIPMLQQMQVDEVFELSCGDALYLPPGIAHHGQSGQASITISVGFRAPGLADLVLAEAEHRAPDLDGRYRDASLALAESADGQISVAAVERALQQISSRSPLYEAMQWFGCLVTETKDWLLPELPEPIPGEQQWQQRMRSGDCLIRHPAVRAAWAQIDDTAFLFVDGQSQSVDPALTVVLKGFCNGTALSTDNPDAVTLLYQLYCAGKLYWRNDH